MITLVANPSSRSGRGRRLWPFWQQRLEASGLPWRLLQSASVPDCMDKAERAAKAFIKSESHCPPGDIPGAMPGAIAGGPGAMPGAMPGAIAGGPGDMPGAIAGGPGDMRGEQGRDAGCAGLGKAALCADPAKGGERNIVAAVGGDGTINAVINGLMRAPDRAAALAVLYAGTSPDFCRFHGLPLDEARAVETLIAGEIRAVDVASLACTPAAEARSYFASSCNIGLGAATAAFANAWRRHLGDLPGTCLGLIRAVLGHKPFSCRLDLDDQSLEFAGVNHVIILKNPHIASGIRANLPLKPDDGLLCAVVIHGYSRFGLLRLLRRFYKGDWPSLPGVFIRYCQNVTLAATPAQAVECDGDPCGTTPVKAHLLPKSLLLVSPGSRRKGGGHA